MHYTLGQKIEGTHEYKRITLTTTDSSIMKKSWVAQEVRPYTGILVGIRNISNGYIGKDGFKITRSIKAHCVVRHLRVNSIYVPINLPDVNTIITYTERIGKDFDVKTT